MDNFHMPTGPKIIFAVLGIIILIEVIYAVSFLSKPTPPPSPSISQSSVELSAGKISLTAPKTTYSVSETVPVSVVVDTGGHEIDGVDLIVHYDPKILGVATESLIKGEIIEEYPLMSLDADKGLINISGLNKPGNGFSGVGQFALINLTAKAAGKTSLTIDYIQKGGTTDSNIVETGTSKDILELVNNLELTVQ